MNKPHCQVVLVGFGGYGIITVRVIIMNNRAKLDEALDRFIGIEDDIEKELDGLDDENEREQFEVVVYEPVESKMPAEARDNDLYDDYQYTRTILRGLIERGTSVLESSLSLAKESEHPRAFEVTNTLMKNISEMSKDLMGLHKHVETQANAVTKEAPKSQTNIQNNYYGAEPEKKGVDDLLDDLDDNEEEK